jgi:transcriptional regulator with XRE-family HTH domain
MTAGATGDKQDPLTQRPRPGAGTPEPVLNPLQRLIQQRMRERDWSYGEVARRGGLPRSTVYTLAMTRNLARPPRPATIDALARGLDVPVSAVRAAAAESTGLHYYDETLAGRQDPGDRERELLIAGIDELTPEDRRHVAALVESLRKKGASPGADRPLAPPPGRGDLRSPGAPRSPPRASSVGQLAGIPEPLGQLAGNPPQDRLRITGRPRHQEPCRHPGCASRRAGTI